MTSTDTVERVARAIFVRDFPSGRIEGRWDEVSEPMREDYRACARAAIAAMPSPDVGEVQVKSLSWESFDAWTWWAKTPIGTYIVEERERVWRLKLRNANGETHCPDEMHGNSEVEAKSSAQVHFAALIGSALTTSKGDT